MTDTRTATQTWRTLLAELLAQGKKTEQASGGAEWRGRTSIELIAHQTVWPMTKPVVLCPDRKLGYRFLAAEAAWVLSGSNRLDEISPYAKQLVDLSDDGVFLSGAYGPMFQEQLPYVAQALARDRQTRQAISTIWRPRPGPSKDIPCLAGDTLVKSPQGDVTIAVLAEKFASGKISKYPVISFDPSTRDVTLKWCTAVWISGKKPIVKVTFTDGSALRCTRDHVVYKKTRRHVPGDPPKTSRTFVEEARIDELSPGDRVWATTFIETGRKKRPAFIKNLSMNWHFENQTAYHTAYAEMLWGKIPDGYDVHHKDENVNNNRDDNLEVIPHGDHSAMKMVGDLNPMRRESTEAKKSRRLKLRDTWIDRGYKVADDRYYELPAGTESRTEVRALTAEDRKRRHRLAIRAAHERLGHKLHAPLDYYDGPVDLVYIQQLASRDRRLGSNHRIESIEPDGFETVYDFTVPGGDNAVVGTGVIVHNCTLSLQWLIRDDWRVYDETPIKTIHCVATMRSSDAWFGIVYDVHVFSMCSVYVALLMRDRLGPLQLGNLYLTAGSQHLYLLDRAHAEKCAYERPKMDDLGADRLRTDEAFELAPFRLEEFRSPKHLTDHLWTVARRDVALSDANWLLETVR